MFIEHGIDYSTFIALTPIVAITIGQVRAIIDRDNHECAFPFAHNCHGKICVHHIDGKDDDPNNIITVCRGAHWEHLHNPATQEEEKLLWEKELSSIARERTSSAKEHGWVFPD